MQHYAWHHRVAMPSRGVDRGSGWTCHKLVLANPIRLSLAGVGPLPTERPDVKTPVVIHFCGLAQWWRTGRIAYVDREVPEGAE